MAIASWPDYARINARQVVTAAPSVRRTEFDDGAVRQARTVSRPIVRVEIEADVPGDRFAAFRTWANLHADTYFTVTALGTGRGRMRVVGGVGGIAYEQVRQGGGTARWLARMTLEDAGTGAPFFGAGADRLILYGRGISQTATLPAAIGDAPPLRYALSPALPARLVVDAATRAVTGIAIEVSAVADYAWTATDAYGRVATVEIPIGISSKLYRNIGEFTATNSAARMTWGAADRAWIPRPWLYRNSRFSWIDYFEITSAGQVTLSIGPSDSATNLRAGILPRLHFSMQALHTGTGKIVKEVTFAGPVDPSAQTRDADAMEPYVWTPSAASVVEIQSFIADDTTYHNLILEMWEVA